MLYLKRRTKDFAITFVEFKKAYDSMIEKQNCIICIDLFKIFNAFGLNNKTLMLIRLILTNTHSKVKFRDEISRAFHIKTGVIIM